MPSFNLLHSCIRDAKVGQNVSIVEPVNIYECCLGDDVFVGPFVEIQSGVLIGSGSKIQSHSFLCTGVNIGQKCFIGHGVMFVNDKFSQGGPANGDRSLWAEIHLGDFVSIGSNSTILPVTICSNVVVGAGSVVTKDILDEGIYAGNPARLIRTLN